MMMFEYLANENYFENLLNDKKLKKLKTKEFLPDDDDDDEAVRQ
jgi:hypothetical protein